MPLHSIYMYMTVSVLLNQTQTMIFCQYNQDWVNRKGYRYLLSQRRRERKGRWI